MEVSYNGRDRQQRGTDTAMCTRLESQRNRHASSMTATGSIIQWERQAAMEVPAAELVDPFAHHSGLVALRQTSSADQIELTPGSLTQHSVGMAASE